MTEATDDPIDSLTGWAIVVISLFILVLLWGLIFTFTVYAEGLAEAFGLSTLRVSSVFSITTASFFIAGGGFGILAARFPLRPVVLAAGVTIAAAVGLLQVVSTYVGLAVAFGMIGAASGTLFVLIISLVPLWFDEYEGRAMGITLAGNGIGVLLLPFVWVWLLGVTDVRIAIGIVGGVLAALVLLASVVAERPHGMNPAGSGSIDAAWFRSMLTDRRFAIALAGYPLLWAWYFVLSSGLVDILVTAGLTRTVAATAFGTIGGISVVTRVASGWIADVIGMRVTMTSGIVLAAIGVFSLPLIGTELGMYATVVTFGIGLGVVATLFSPILLGRFGPENASAIVGLFTIAESTTAFLAPVGISVLVETLGGYQGPLVLLGLLTLLGAGMFHWGTAPARTAPSSPGGR